MTKLLVIPLAVLMGVAEAVAGGDTPGAAWWAPLINSGAIGVVLLWFMLRMEPRMRGIEASIDRIARALMIAVIALRGVDRAIAEQAQEIVNEVDAAKTNAK